MISLCENEATGVSGSRSFTLDQLLPAEINAFFEGYGGSPLSEEEYEYFVGLYEFF
jgi:hypothetical protein